MRAKVGYEAEIPAKVLYVYSGDVNVAELVKETRANLLWLELGDDSLYETYDFSQIPLPPQNVFIVCRKPKCVKELLQRGFNPILDVELSDDLVDVPYAIRLRYRGAVRFIVLGDAILKPNAMLYTLDRVIT